MSKTLIFGHKNPDTDSITSSLVMANLEKALGNDVEACRLGKINKETQYVLDYLKMDPPTLIESVEDGADVILVDHNNPMESIDNIDNVNVKKVIDHHAVVLTTGYPLYYRAEPLGCTETVLYKLYKEYGVEITKEIATLMVSGIVSDTLLFKSPTCTPMDKEVAEELAKKAGVDIVEYGLEMLKAGTDISDLSVDEILALDAKEIDIKGNKVLINQVNTASIDDVMKMKDALEEGINKAIEEKGLDLFMLLITDIVNSNSQTISIGKRADLVEKSYNVVLEDNTALLEGVVSRKKEVIPVLTDNA